ncbi:MAG: Gldg family protein [Planctomycetota bacterium]
MFASALIQLLFLDILFLGFLLAAMLLLAYFRPVALAVVKRNFYAYFANPTGYVFLCLFVLLTSMAAFWPHEFFSSNLGTLSELNKWFTYIMLFFIPAITMSIWAEERRQGTDELLLTLPADDFDIVIGKYVAAAAIYTVSLLFSQLSNFTVLALLTKGEVDTGLFFTNYLGYWLIGLAMIAIGMVASFLTNNLTVGFILGALFNAPLAFAAKADTITGRPIAREIKNFSLSERFDDFGRGVISLSGLAYFTLVAIFGLYLCLILIGKRHWSSGKDGSGRWAHYVLRSVLLFVTVVAGSMFFRNRDYFRKDATELQVSSLSPVTTDLIRNLGKERDIVVEAYISEEVPEMYAKTKYELVSLLKEFESTANKSGVPMEVRIYDSIAASSEEEKQAEQQYGIVSQTVRVRERGTISDQPIILGAAFRSGLQKVVIPFFEPGIPVEYELARSLTTVAKPVRKKLGVLKTDAKMMGGLDMRSFQQQPQQPIIEELGKQYELIDVNPASPIDGDRIDVLLAVQPSSLSPEEMNNFVAAVTSGIPTAIFEDPQSAIDPSVPGTGDPKPPMGGGMFGGGAPAPKGLITRLWEELDIDVPGQPSGTGYVSPDLCWQQYNPYPVLAAMDQSTDLWIFVREEAPGAEDALSEESEISKGLKELMFLLAGTIRHNPNSTKTTFMPLASTGSFAGTIPLQEVRAIQRSGLGTAEELRVRRGNPAPIPQVIAAYIEGIPPKSADESPAPVSSKPLKVVYVSDLDCMSSVFVDIRKNPSQLDEIKFQFQNITFVLNAIDVLAGETRYPAIRRHVPTYSTLKLVEEQADKARRDEAEERSKVVDKFNESVAAAEEASSKAERQFKEAVDKLQSEGAIDSSKLQELNQRLQEYQIKQAQLSRKLDLERSKLQRERDRNIREARGKADDSINKIQNYYKMLAVFIPPIPPLIVGIVVLVSRRLREREGISKNRLR